MGTSSKESLSLSVWAHCFEWGDWTEFSLSHTEPAVHVIGGELVLELAQSQKTLFSKSKIPEHDYESL